MKRFFPFVGRFPVVSVGVVRWVESTVTEPSYFKLCTEHTPIHLALLDEVVTCHILLHPKVLQLLIQLFESKQDELEILVQVRVYPINPLTPKLNPPVQCHQPRFFSGHLISNACS
jgi:hypothetical protein